MTTQLFMIVCTVLFSDMYTMGLNSLKVYPRTRALHFAVLTIESDQIYGSVENMQSMVRMNFHKTSATWRACAQLNQLRHSRRYRARFAERLL